MVTRVYGLANGAEVIFSHIKENVWEVRVPWTEDGKYVAEIFAEDEAGNQSHLCKMMFIISGHELRAIVSEEEYQAEINEEGVYNVECIICGRGSV